MPDRAPVVDLRILGGGAAEHHDQLGMLDHDFPGDHQVRDIGTPQDIRHDSQRRSVTVIACLVDIAAMQAEDALQHTGGVVKTAGAGPAVGAAVNRGVSEFRLDPAQFRFDHSQRSVPIHRDESFPAAIMGRAFPSAQVSGPDVGAVNP